MPLDFTCMIEHLSVLEDTENTLELPTTDFGVGFRLSIRIEVPQTSELADPQPEERSWLGLTSFI